MAEPKPLYQPWNEDAFQSSIAVKLMNHQQIWMYRSLLQAAFFNECRPYLPNDDRMLAVLAGCESLQQWKDNKDAILEWFTLREDDLWEHKRVTEDWERIAAAREKMVVAGKRSGESRRKTPSKGVEQPSNDVEPTSKEVEQEKLKRSEVSEVKRSEEKRREDKEFAAAPLSSSSSPHPPSGHENMPTVATKMMTICRKVLGARPERLGNMSQTGSDLKKVINAYGADEVLEAFEDWCKVNAGTVQQYPISKFLNVVDGILSGTIVVKASEELESMMTRFRTIAGTDVTFDNLQMAALNRLLGTYSQDDIVLAFRQFYSQLDLESSYQMNRAGRDFAEKADQYIKAILEGREQEKKRRETSERYIAEERARIEQEKEERRASEKAEEAQSIGNPFDGLLIPESDPL